MFTHLNFKESTSTRSNGDHMHHLENYEKTTLSKQGVTKIIPCRAP